MPTPALEWDSVFPYVHKATFKWAARLADKNSRTVMCMGGQMGMLLVETAARKEKGCSFLWEYQRPN